MLLGKTLESIGIECPDEYKNIEFSEIVTDSRKAKRGCMFVCLGGHNRDGHDYINEAIKNGAVVVVAERVRDGCVGGAAIVEIENTSRCAALLYNLQSEKPTERLKIIGVTGTNGKTSTCAALECIMRSAGMRVGVIGTLGCFADGRELSTNGKRLTTPEAEELYVVLRRMADMGITHVLMEVSSHALAFGRTDAITFEYGVFTNLTRDHLDFHGDMEKYFACKAKLFGQSHRGVVNFDDPYGKRLFETYGGVLRSSRTEGDSIARDIVCNGNGCEYTLGYKEKEYRIRVGAVGDFSVTNTQLAATVALDMGISPEAVIGGLAHFFGADGRMKRVMGDICPFDVFIDYAHTPDGLENALMSVRGFSRRDGRIILVFGCGGDRDVGKRKEMANIASRLSDFVVITSDNPRSEAPRKIIGDILKGIDKEKPHTVIASRREAIEYAVGIAAAGDTILLAGKGHEKYEIDAEGYHPFDEEQIVKDAIKKIKTQEIYRGILPQNKKR